MQLSDCYFLGTITKKHGLKGHLVLKLDTDEPELYHTLESVFVEKNATLVPFFISEITVLSNNALKVLFKEVEPETLIGSKTYLPLTHLPELTGKQFYYHEVIGFSILVENKMIGEIIEVNDKAAQPLFIVAKENSEEIYIPIINDWILKVNRELHTLEMQLPEGLLEL